MPKPEIEIKKINVESPKREIKEKWLTENPGTTSADFEAFRTDPSFKTWEPEALEWRKVASDYWSDQNLNIPSVKAADQKLGMGKFSTGNQAETTYNNLIRRFESAQFSGTNHPNWSLPQEALSEWSKLVASKREQVQRNALDLASVIAKTRALAGEEMRALGGSNSSGDAWAKSDLNVSLEKLGSSLETWDKLLSESAEPARHKLQNLANELRDNLNAFTSAHAKVFAVDANPPFVRYEVLATVKAVSDKVASQFGARTAEPSFSGMYDRILDVPRSSAKKEAKALAKEISSTYDGDLRSFWDVQMPNLETLALRLGHGTNFGLELKTKIYTVNGGAKEGPIRGDLKKFSDAYGNMASQPTAIVAEMSSSVGNITTHLVRYKNAVEDVMKKYVDQVDGVRDVRNQYRRFFDSVTQYVQTGVETCERIG